MKFLYYCNSAYQIINVLNLHLNRKYEGFEFVDNYEADLILLNAFKGADLLYKNIVSSKEFNKVWLIDRYSNKGLFHAFSSLFDILFPSIYIKKKYNINKKDVNSYDRIVVPKFSKITGAIWQLNRKSELDIYDDGIFVLHPNDKKHLYNSSSKTYMFYSLFNYNRDFLKFKRIYINNVDIYNGEDFALINKIPNLNSRIINRINKIISSNSNCCKNNTLYWLGDFINKDIESKIYDCIKENKNIIYRPHPRHGHTIDGIKNDNVEDIWEVKILNTKEIDNICLLSIISSSCFTPKLLFDKEPYIILCYKLLNDKRFDSFDDAINRFAKTYKNENRIMVPSTLSEFESCIDKLSFLE